MSRAEAAWFFLFKHHLLMQPQEWLQIREELVRLGLIREREP